MSPLEQAVIDAALRWEVVISAELQTTASAFEQLADEELKLYEAVCAYRAAKETDPHAKRA